MWPRSNFHTKSGESFTSLLQGVENGTAYTPSWSITKGDGVIKVSETGQIEALQHR